MIRVFPSLVQSNMADAVEIVCFSFLKQQIVRRIYWKSERLELQPLSGQVIDAVVQFYCAGSPVWNYSLFTVVI